MSTETAAIKSTYYRWPKSMISRFVAKRTYKSAIGWGLVFGLYAASKAIGFVQAYTTEAARRTVAATFSSNVGIKVLLGSPNHIDTVPGFITWNVLSVLVIFGAIWAPLTATKYFRGEEDSGRFELLLSGQTSMLRAAANVLSGLGFSICLLYAVSAIGFVLVGRYHGINYSAESGLFFALSVISAAALFMAIGALSSQLMPTRSRAAGLSMGIFGLFFLIRAMADVTSARWLLTVTPLGWIEKLQPLYASQPQWLLPIGLLIAIIVVVTLIIAARRDLGDSIFADHVSSRPHIWLLNTPVAIAIRLTRTAMAAWLSIIGLTALMYGVLAKSAAQAFTNALRNEREIKLLTHSSSAAAAQAFLGIIFFLQMVIIMAFAASCMGSVRKDEAEGYLDNLLVRKVGRRQWLWGRIGVIGSAILLAGFLSGLLAWAGAASQHTGVPIHLLLEAGLNAIAPAVLTLGVGVFAFGFFPRYTTVLAYAVLIWSFLLEMVSSGIRLSHWVLDTSIFNQVAFVPANKMNWTSFSLILVIGLILAFIGVSRFNKRDIEVA